MTDNAPQNFTPNTSDLIRLVEKQLEDNISLRQMNTQLIQELAKVQSQPQAPAPQSAMPPAPSVPATGTAPPAPATPAEAKQNYNVIVQRKANTSRSTPESRAANAADWDAIINPLRQADNKRRYG